MLMALLYNQEDTIIAAAPACDQIPMGERYWNDVHPFQLSGSELFETAYMNVVHPALRRQLMSLGLDDSIDRHSLTAQVEQSAIPNYVIEKAA